MLVERILKQWLDVQRDFLPLLIRDQILGNEEFVDERDVNMGLGLELDSGRESFKEGTRDIEPGDIFVDKLEFDEVNFVELVVVHFMNLL